MITLNIPLSPGRHLLTLLFIVIPASNFFAQTPPPAGTATVAGRVTLGGDPARGVHVVLQAYYPSGPSDRDKALRAKTDAEGHFRFTGVYAGRYRLLARPASNDEAPDRPAWPAAWDNAARAQLRQEAAAAKIEIELQPCQQLKEQTIKYAAHP